MRIRRMILGLAFASCTASAAPAQAVGAAETAAQRDARMAWWRDAQFGMFVHWGAYAVPAGVHSRYVETYRAARLREMGQWLRANGEALYATTGSPYEAPARGRYTTAVEGAVAGQ